MPHETATSDKKFPPGRDFLFCRKPPSLKVLALLVLHASNGPAMSRSIVLTASHKVSLVADTPSPSSPGERWRGFDAQCVRKPTSPQSAPLRYPAVRARDVVRRRIDLDVDAAVALGPIDRPRFCHTDTWTNHRGGSGGHA